MNFIDIKLKNCFGIGRFHHKFEYKQVKTNSFLIYAPNGTMKTSFAKTLDLISKNEPKSMPGDSVYSDRISEYKVFTDVGQIPIESILVVNAENSSFDATDKISSFIASKDLKKKYDKIYSELENQKSEYLKKLKQISQSTDCEVEFVNTFSESSKSNFFELFSTLSGFIDVKINSWII